MPVFSQHQASKILTLRKCKNELRPSYSVLPLSRLTESDPDAMSKLLEESTTLTTSETSLSAIKTSSGSNVKVNSKTSLCDVATPEAVADLIDGGKEDSSGHGDTITFKADTVTIVDVGKEDDGVIIDTLIVETPLDTTTAAVDLSDGGKDNSSSHDDDGEMMINSKADTVTIGALSDVGKEDDGVAIDTIIIETPLDTTTAAVDLSDGGKDNSSSHDG
jgi:hypothetical protein